LASGKCGEAVLVDKTEKKDLADGMWGFMANYRVALRNDYNLFCLYASGCITIGVDWQAGIRIL
jgi:hypothetical protein